MWSSRKLAVVSAVGGLFAIAACNSRSKTEYSESPDSGKIAPAMVQDTSLSRTYPDSNTAKRTGKPGVAGDTLSTRGQPAGTKMTQPDTANRAKSRPRP